MIEYPRYLSLPKDFIKNKVKEFLAEDAPRGDITSSAIFKNETVEAYIEVEEDLVFAGRDILECFFTDKYANIEVFVFDGEKIKKGSIIAKIKGSAFSILIRERVLLNLLQRLCGIATLTSKYVAIAQPYGVKILDTRKTTPGLRLFEKYAVACGGGYNHRLNLSSGILIKDNHIKTAGSVANAVNSIKTLDYGLPIELEVDTFEQINEGLHAGADGFLLDNMSPDKVKKAVELIRKSRNGENIFIEASGGINLDNLKDYVVTGINAVSVGALTHSIKSANIHIEFED